jgi:phosphate transport system substrate-binding protein
MKLGKTVLITILMIVLVSNLALTEAKIVRIKGSSTVLPIAESCAEAFMTKHPNTKVAVSGGGSSVGIKAVATGEADIGTASREVKKSEIKTYKQCNFVDHKIALDGVAVIVSKEIYDSDVKALSIKQIRDIYKGEINNWKEVGGPDKEIFVNEREEGSGTRDTFMEVIDLEETQADKANAHNSDVKQAVAGSDKAIGYVGLGYVGEDTPAIAVDGVFPSKVTIRKGTYKITRSLHMYTNGKPTGIVKEFINFVLSKEGQRIVEEEGFLGIR